MSTQESNAGQDRFPIRELSAQTNVNTVTIRAWERRYGLLNPERTSKGHRLYSQSDVTTIEKILGLVARGVPLRKVKALLAEGGVQENLDTTDSWAEPIDKLASAIQAFSSSRIEHIIDDSFLNYPPNVCRERLIEPTLEVLAQSKQQEATALFAESELIRYTLLRLNTKASKHEQRSMMLVCGENTPLWRLALVAMELTDAGFKTQLVTRSFSVNAFAELTEAVPDSPKIFYQDGQWRQNEAEKVGQLLQAFNNIKLVGTAPLLAGLEDNEHVFNDLSQCVRSLAEATQADNQVSTEAI